MDRRLKELHRSIKMIEDVLKYAYEGYVLVDTEGKIVMIEYEKLLGIKEEDAIGEHIADVIENTRLHIVVKTGVEELRRVQRIQGHDVITNRIPIVMNGEIIGALGTVLFKDINEVKELAHHLLDLQSKINKYKVEIERIEGAKYSFDNILSVSPSMNYLKRVAKKAAETNSTVLITGKSGTGKELFAQAIHKAGYRKNQPFIAINCAAIPKGLLESELFGYEKGAFTGAKEEGKPGKFELAQSGTIFLDEIGDMPMDMQVKLLRVLEAKEFERVGGTKKLQMDARVIAATNENLERQMEEGRFREDLYYRLNVISIDIPPLKDRPEDIPIIADKILDNLSRELVCEKRQISREAMEVLKSYDWPGNVRELRNVLERATNLSNSKDIRIEDLPDRLLYRTNTDHAMGPKEIELKSLNQVIEEAEIGAIKNALEVSNNNKSRAAEILGIHRTSLYRRMEKYKIN